jgi:hypothetical protein
MTSQPQPLKALSAEPFSPLAPLPAVTVSPAATVPSAPRTMPRTGLLVPHHQGVPQGMPSFARGKGRGW